MKPDQISRRRFIARAGQWAVLGGGASILAACGGGDDGGAVADSACIEPDLLRASELSLRRSADYTDEAPAPAEACAACAYFHPDGEAACGRCDILQGPVSQTGHCTSWAQAA